MKLASDVPRSWQLLKTDIDTAESKLDEADRNMGIDASLLSSVSTNEAPATLRLYQWKHPAVTIGRFQDINRTIHHEECMKRAIPISRRPTGGRGILHGDDLTVAIAASLDDLGFTNNPDIISIYRRIAQGLIVAFNNLGIPSQMGLPKTERARELRGDCFSTISKADLIESASGSKLLGAAMLRRDRYILFQSSIPLYSSDLKDAQRALSAEIFRGELPIRPLAAAAGIDPVDLSEKIVSGLCTVLNCHFV